MFRFILLFSMLFSVVSPCMAQAPAAQSSLNPAAVAAKQNFDQLFAQWKNSIQKLQQKSQENAGSGGKEDKEFEALHQQVEAMVDMMVAAGVQVHQAGLTDDPTVNSILVNIAGFYVGGDPEGDGGDQYEKALPVIKQLLDAGLGETSKELWLWGGVSAFCLNDFGLAEKYFNKAEDAGLMGNIPPGPGPLGRIWQLAIQQKQNLSATQKAWQNEQAIRVQEKQADNLPRVKLQTSRGDIVIELFENEAPQATASFINLVKKGFYDGVVFHRVLPAFMAQGGDPTGSGSGGPGYNIRCECYSSNYRRHFRGTLSMAHAGRDTGGSQFFLTFVPTSYLDGKHTAFGRVVEGIDVASSLKRVTPDPRATGPSPETDKIVKAQVLRDRGHEYQFEKLPER